MLRETIRQIRPAIMAVVVMTVLTGLLYPAVVTTVVQTVFPKQADGSLLEHDGKVVGSVLIGQPFSDPKYFWGRLSATSPKPYDASMSNGSNLGPLNPFLVGNAKARIQALKEADAANTASIPVDLVTASGSGLDPHISVSAAEYQIARVAKARKLSVEQVGALVWQFSEPRELGILGEPRVNVLMLNLALDEHNKQ